MYPNKKASVRIKVMNSMMKEKPSIAMKKPQMEPMAEEGIDGMEMHDESNPEYGQKGLVQMPVSPEEKMMILKLRKQKGQSEGMM